jgi:hypothetical protein
MLARPMAEATFTNLHVDRADGVATITLDRPKQLNALDAATLRELARAVRDIRRDAGVRAVIVTGAGEKAFSAGADIAAMAAMSAGEGHAYSRLGHEVSRSGAGSSSRSRAISSSPPRRRGSGSPRSISASSLDSAGRSGSSGASARRGRERSSTSDT